MARYGRLLTDAQWEKIRPLLPRRRKRPTVDDRLPLTAKYWKAFCGFCAAGLVGAIPEEFPSPSTCWRACEIGRSKRSGWRSGARS